MLYIFLVYFTLCLFWGRKYAGREVKGGRHVIAGISSNNRRNTAILDSCHWFEFLFHDRVMSPLFVRRRGDLFFTIPVRSP